MKGISKEIIGAAASSIILSVLKKGDSYGYEIVRMVKELSKGDIKWKEASIYPVLKKLENEGLIRSYWNVQEGQRPRKYYSVEADGIELLESHIIEWNSIQSLLSQLWI
jgi:PadR family transcriptional regulator, regulatory protein PadR